MLKVFPCQMKVLGEVGFLLNFGGVEKWIEIGSEIKCLTISLFDLTKIVLVGMLVRAHPIG